MVRFGDADAYVSGLNFNYPDVIRPRCKSFIRARV